MVVAEQDVGGGCDGGEAGKVRGAARPGGGVASVVPGAWILVHHIASFCEFMRACWGTALVCATGGERGVGDGGSCERGDGNE